MERLIRKFKTAADLVPQPVLRAAKQKTPLGVIYFGSTSPAMHEALDVLEEDGIYLDALRLRAYPFPESVRQFIAGHEKVFVVEQNRDAQMRSMLINEMDIDPARLVRVLHYDGTPITARFIARAIRDTVQPAIPTSPGLPRAKELA
jgi:2-oxoglutarate ferredoxin oxidoreductase subunit alpha